MIWFILLLKQKHTATLMVLLSCLHGSNTTKASPPRRAAHSKKNYLSATNHSHVKQAALLPAVYCQQPGLKTKLTRWAHWSLNKLKKYKVREFTDKIFQSHPSSTVSHYTRGSSLDCSYNRDGCEVNLLSAERVNVHSTWHSSQTVLWRLGMRKDYLFSSYSPFLHICSI